MSTHYGMAPTLLAKYMGVKKTKEEYSMGEMLDDTKTRYLFWCGGNGGYRVRTGLVFEDILVTAEHNLDLSFVTDRDLNPLSNGVLDVFGDLFDKAKEQKRAFLYQSD